MGNSSHIEALEGVGLARKWSDLHFKSIAEGWFYYPCERMGEGRRRRRRAEPGCELVSVTGKD